MTALILAHNSIFHFIALIISIFIWIKALCTYEIPVRYRKEVKDEYGKTRIESTDLIYMLFFVVNVVSNVISFMMWIVSISHHKDDINSKTILFIAIFTTILSLISSFVVLYRSDKQPEFIKWLVK